MRKIRDLTGQKFGRLTVVALAPRRIPAAEWWVFCECEPDGMFIVMGNSLVRGNTKSCGCLRAEYLKSERAKEHRNKIAANTHHLFAPRLKYRRKTFKISEIELG